jgi:hypothetical protein
MKSLLIQTQLSNYDTSGKFILEADSGYQMCMGRIRQLMKLEPDLKIDIMLPALNDCKTSPFKINPDLFGDERINPKFHSIIPNALATRYDFHFDYLKSVLNLRKMNYDAVYINDPMHLRTMKALFHLNANKMPKFFVHSHFIDNPECPKFPVNASLWLGQCEAAIKADFNFWQCEAAMNVFFDSMSKTFQQPIVDDVRKKSLPWDDGYSNEEINIPVNMKNIRFSTNLFAKWKHEGKTIIFVPNRIGGFNRSSDYTNCGKFMFEILPLLRRRNDSYVVIAGNPSQKFLNYELVNTCGHFGYVSIVDDALNRDEFKFVCSQSDFAVGLYDQDTYGGTAAREAVELGALPLWLDVNEYSALAKKAGWQYLLGKTFDNLNEIAYSIDTLIKLKKATPNLYKSYLQDLQKVVRQQCSYEQTTQKAYQIMKSLVENK